MITADRKPDRWFPAIAAITALGALARIIGLNSGMWIDEIYSLVRSVREPLGTIFTTYWGDAHHPLYAVLSHLSRSVFGEYPWSLRLPAALAGIATVPALALLAREVTSRREALAAAAILALSYHHVWFSQNARGYTAIALCTVLAMYFALRAMRSGRAADWAAYALVAALGAFTHLTMIFVVVGHAVAVVLELLLSSRRDAGRGAVPRRRAWVGAISAFGAAAALTLLLYAPMMSDVIAFFSATESKLVGVSTGRWAALEGLRVLALGLSGGVLAIGLVVVLAGAIVGVAGTVSFARRAPLFVLLLVMPVAVTLAGAALTRGTFYPRFLFFAIGPVLVIAVRGTFVLAGWIGARLGRPAMGESLGVSATVAVAALSAVSLGANYRYPKQDYEGAMRHVLASRAPADLILSTGVPADPYRSLYGQDWPNVSTLRELNELRAPGQRAWVLYTFPRYIAVGDPGLLEELRAGCREPRVFRGTVGDGDIHVCHLDPK